MNLISLKMIFNKTDILSLVGLLLISTTISCGQKNNRYSKDNINNFIKMANNEPVEIFQDWNIWERNDGFVFDFMEDKFRFLIVNNKEDFLYKEIFPKQDSVFHSLLELESIPNHYPFPVGEFSAKVSLFKKLKVDQVNSINEDSLIMFIKQDFSIIYTKKGIDVRELNRYKEYSRYDDNWYYYLKKQN